MGVYADRTANPFDDPKVEPIAKLAKRHNLAVGIVTNTEIEDATPEAIIRVAARPMTISPSNILISSRTC